MDKPEDTKTESKRVEKLYCCHYCGKKRLPDALELTEVWVNGAKRIDLYCIDTDCAVCAQNSAEG